MATRASRKKQASASDYPGDIAAPGRQRVPLVSPGEARDVTVIRCADEVAAAELLSYPDIAATVLGRLDDRHLLLDPGKEEAFTAAAIKHKLSVPRTAGTP